MRWPCSRRRRRPTAAVRRTRPLSRRSTRPPASRPPSARPETVWIQAPQRLRFDYAAPDKKIYTYDAGEGRFFSPEDKQLTIRKLSPDEQARLPLVFLGKPEDLAARYDIQKDASGAVLLKPRSADSDLAWLKLVVVADGMVENLSYEDTAGNRSEFRFEDWKPASPRPAADYRITGPKGTRIVEN